MLDALQYLVAAAITLGWFFAFQGWRISRALKKAAHGPWGVRVPAAENDPNTVELGKKARRYKVFGAAAFIVAFAAILAPAVSIGPDFSIQLLPDRLPRAKSFSPEEAKALQPCVLPLIVFSWSVVPVPILLVIALARVVLAQRYRRPERRALFPDTFQSGSYALRGLGHLRGARLFGLLAVACLIVAIVVLVGWEPCLAHRT